MKSYTQLLAEKETIIKEDEGGFSGGVAYADASNVSGMGDIVSAQPSTLSGTTVGDNWSANGGTVGSGDVSTPFNSKPYQKEMGVNHGARTGKKSRVKKMDLKALKNALSKKQDYTAGQGERGGKKIMNFQDFEKEQIDKVHKVNQ